MRKTLLATMALAASVTLAACGGATVDSEDVTATPSAPAENTATESSAESSTESSSSSTSSSSSAAPSASEQPEDIGAREVEEVPEPPAQYAQEEQAFLDEITGASVNVDSVEDQLIGTAQTICSGDTVTRDVVVGQLIEQERTDMNAEELSTLLDEAAQDNLC